RPVFTSPACWVIFFSSRSFPGISALRNSLSLGSGNKTICLLLLQFIYLLSSHLLLLQIRQPGGGTVRLEALTDQFRPAAAGAALGDGIGDVLHSVEWKEEYSAQQQNNVSSFEKVTSIVGFVFFPDQPPIQ